MSLYVRVGAVACAAGQGWSGMWNSGNPGMILLEVCMFCPCDWIDVS